MDLRSYLKLYLPLAGPHLDNAVQFWGPYHMNDSYALKAIRRRMTNLMQIHKSLVNRDILKRLNLYSLERRNFFFFLGGGI